MENGPDVTKRFYQELNDIQVMINFKPYFMVMDGFWEIKIKREMGIWTGKVEINFQSHNNKYAMDIANP